MVRDERKLTARRAVEALRNGVPNRAAVETLGCRQPKAETAFDELLNRAGDAGSGSGRAQGMLVSGDFGAGKSHLLAHLERRALAQGFVCSTVAVSKETPLYDLGKVFRSAVENARMPDRGGRLFEELGAAADRDSAHFAAFVEWVETAASDGVLHGIFPAAVAVYEGARNPEINARIESFWAGDRIRVSEIKQGLRPLGQGRRYAFRAPKVSELPPQRLRFAVELMRGAGYRGWVVLLDEIELVGSYSLLQRGRSYAELARWLGQVPGDACPGLIAVGTVTGDFAAAIIGPDGKHDREGAGRRLADSRHADRVRPAEAGMRLLERKCVRLSAPTADDVRDTLETLRRLYGEAYAWEAPRLETGARGVGVQARMRYKVRAAINAWDLLRIYPDSRPETVGGEFRHAYRENRDLEGESVDDAGDAQE